MFWNFGFLLGFTVLIQVITGVLLSMHYTANTTYAYYSVVHIVREIYSGWLIRYLHTYFASFLFLLLYLHIFRAIMYNSYNYIPYSWVTGIVMYAMYVIIGFLGYVLPWGQMSFWGATVICNLLTVPSLITWVLGGYVISNPTIQRFFIFHFILPFVTFVLIIIHMYYLHLQGSNNPLGHNIKLTVPFYPQVLVLDLQMFYIYLSLIYIQFLFSALTLSHPDNANTVNAFITPLEIVPEWYFLPFYAMLKAIPNKIIGLLMFVYSILLYLTFKTNISKIPTFKTQSLSAIIIPNIIYALVIIGAQLPHTVFISYDRVFTLLYLLAFLSNSNILPRPYTYTRAVTSSAFTYISTCNHKLLGLYYLWFAIIFGILGALLSFIIRTELYTSGVRIIPTENLNYYNLAFTLHGVVMIFFHAMPGLLGGFGNYLLPLYNAASEVAFPRINGLSLVLLPASYACVLMSLVSEMGVGTGWTLYPPLSTTYLSMSVDFILVGLAVSGISSLMSSVNFITTIFQIRTKGLIISTLPLVSWAYAIVSALLIVTLPILTGAVLMLLTDMHLNTTLFTGTSGDPVLFQHLFWFFGHPEVYVLILPAFAIISQVISYNYQKPVFGYHSMVVAMACIGILGSLVWAHHLYTVGLEVDTRAYFTAITILISVPTGTKIFNWLSTYMGSATPATISGPAILCLLFIVMFTLGGTTGVVLGNGAVDIALHDTYYVVGHFHFVLSIGAVLAFITGLLHYQTQMLGSAIISRSCSIVFIFVFITGILLTFVPMHFLGFHVMPRRIPDYPDYFNSWNAIASIGSTISLLSLVFLGSNIIHSSRGARIASSYGRLNCYYSNTILLYSHYMTGVILTSSILFHYNLLLLAFLYTIRESYYFMSNISIFVYSVVLSEFLLFVSYFWAYYHLYTTLPGIVYPTSNSLVLMIVIILSNLSIQYNALLSIILAIVFTTLQSSEFMLLEFSINDSTYSSLFFCLTSLHFSHVFVGIYLLLLFVGTQKNTETFVVNKSKAVKNYWAYTLVPVVNNLSLLYWHLIEILWVFIDTVLYTY